MTSRGRCCWLRVSTFLRVSDLLCDCTTFDHHVQQHPAEGLHHRVRLAHLHLQGVGVVSVGCRGSKVMTNVRLRLIGSIQLLKNKLPIES